MLKKIDIAKQSLNPFSLIGEEWMLLSAGKTEKWNTMTVSWGGVGVFWGTPAATCYVRHSRYTHEFMDDNDFFTLTVLQPEYKSVHGVLGAQSGRDIDKMHQSGLTPLMLDGQPSFAEAKLVLICRKKCKSEIAEGDILQPETMERWYADRDFHTMYIGEIIAAYAAE